LNEVPPDQGEADEVDDLYRRASAADSSRPSESVRRAVLDHAAKLAAQRSPETGPVKLDFTQRAANQPWRRPAILGTLAAAALAGFMIAPQFFSPRVADTSVSSTVENTQRQSAAAPSVKQPANASQTPLSASRGPNAPPMPYSAPSLPANTPPVPFPAAPEMQADKRRDLKTDVPARVAGRVEASPRGTAADAARAETESLAKVLTSQAQSAADAPASAAAAAPTSPALRSADRSAELRHAAEIGDVSTLKAVLGTQPLIDARDDAGRTALMLATLRGQSAAVEVLLASGADPNAADTHGTTPLQAAVAGIQPAIAAALRRAGAR
jgi:Ankyrin repeats (3 copies)